MGHCLLLRYTKPYSIYPNTELTKERDTKTRPDNVSSQAYISTVSNVHNMFLPVTHAVTAVGLCAVTT